MTEKLKLPRLTRREWHLLKIMAILDEHNDWQLVSEIAVLTSPDGVFNARAMVKSLVPGVTAELDRLVARHLIERNPAGDYRLTPFSAWAELAWNYHYTGTLHSTAVKVFGIENPVLMPKAAIMYAVSEEALGRLFDITDDDETAYKDYLAELEQKRLASFKED